MTALEGDSVVRGGAWTTVAGVLPQLYTLVISIAAARVLGPADFGRQSFIAFVGVTAQMVLTIGLGIALSRSVAEALGRREWAQARGLVFWTLRWQILGALIGGGVLVVPALLGSEPAAAWALAGVATAAGIIQSVFAAALGGAHRFRDAAVVGLTTGAVAVPVLVLVLLAGGGIVGIFAVEAVVALINAAWTWILTRRTLTAIAPAGERAPHLERAALRFAGLTTVGAVLALIVWKRSEFFFLAHFGSDAQIGLYSIAFAVTGAISILPERLSTVATPVFARLRGEDEDEGIREGFGRLVRLLVLAMLPLACGIAAVGPELLRLIYGSDYAGVGPVVMVLSVGLPFAALAAAANSLLAGLDDARRPLIAGAFAAAINIVLAFALIPGLDALGAALANVGGQVVAAVAVAIPAVAAAGGMDWHRSYLVRGVLAAVGSGLVARGFVELVGGVGGVVLGVAGGAAAFVALAVVLRVLMYDDAAWAEGAIGHRLGGRAGNLLRRVAGPCPA